MACLMNLLRHLQRNKTLGNKSVIARLPDYKFDPEEHFEDVCVLQGQMELMQHLLQLWPMPLLLLPTQKSR